MSGWSLGLAAATAALSSAGTWLVLGFVRRHALLDHPNERSSHHVPTPRGGGLAVIAVLLTAWTVALLVLGDGAIGAMNGALVIVLSAVLALVSWLDDLRDLPVGVRLVAQVSVVAAGVALLPEGFSLSQGWLPSLVDRVLAGLVWLWFLNLYNFMDGIDGITAVETLVVAGGLALLAALGAWSPAGGMLALLVAAAALGFLPWNWHPAKIFLGDVGSVTLGFLLGWLLLWAAASGAWAAALILPLYYLVDATFTLLRRAAKGERIWQAHAQHMYQVAVRRGFTHGEVAARVFVAGLVLVGFAVIAIRGGEDVALLCAVLTVGALMGILSRGREAPPVSQG